MGIEKLNVRSGMQIKVSPNPMTYSATISYVLSEENYISVSIFSATGIKIRTLVNENQGPGYQSLTWDGCSDNGTPVTRGIYICLLSTSEYFISGKIIKY
jgi:flagellar hook assembly protein FlgD